MAVAPALTADALRATFDAPAPLTVGLEEEVFLLDPRTLDLAPRAAEVVDALGEGSGVKLELPAAQLEVATAPAPDVPTAIAELTAGRARLAAAGVRCLAAGVHPFAAPEGRLNRGERYEALEREYGSVIRRQLVSGLQVHVALGDAELALAVYNALRAHLPELAALAANAPFHGGRDTGLASVRPTICELLPRQGVPPAFPSWEAFAEALRWGGAAGALPGGHRWWWELRPHPRFGTLELRVPDAQVTVADAAAVAAVAHALVARLAARARAGELPPPAPTWRIEENRWSALRHGVEGTLADLETGEARPARERLHALLDELGESAQALGCAAELEAARGLVEANGALRQRAVAAERGVRGLTAWLAEAFAP